MSKKELCEMCTEYSTEIKCENKSACKLMALIDENTSLKNQIKELKKENSDLRLNMSYMTNPNAIGDRNDMGW